MDVDATVARVRADAENLFAQRGFYCSEAIVSAIRDHLDPDMPEALIAAASGFPVGIGKSKCLCGAVAGSVLCLGYFFGRTAPSDPADERSMHTLTLADEVQQHFRDNHRVLCCSVQTKGMDMASGEHRAQCTRFTGEMAQKTAEVIIRERR